MIEKTVNIRIEGGLAYLRDLFSNYTINAAHKLLPVRNTSSVIVYLGVNPNQLDNETEMLSIVAFLDENVEVRGRMFVLIIYYI